MSTDLIKEEDGKGYSLTQYAGKDGLMYQITQDYSTKETEPGILYLRGCTGYVCVSEQDLKDMLKAIKHSKQG